MELSRTISGSIVSNLGIRLINWLEIIYFPYILYYSIIIEKEVILLSKSIGSTLLSKSIRLLFTIILLVNKSKSIEYKVLLNLKYYESIYQLSTFPFEGRFTLPMIHYVFSFVGLLV